MISPTRRMRRSGNFAPRLVGVLDRALDAVAEAELAREADGDVADRERVTPCLEKIYEPSGVVAASVPWTSALRPNPFRKYIALVVRGHARQSSRLVSGFGTRHTVSVRARAAGGRRSPALNFSAE